MLTPLQSKASCIYSSFLYFCLSHLTLSISIISLFFFIFLQSKQSWGTFCTVTFCPVKLTECLGSDLLTHQTKRSVTLLRNLTEPSTILLKHLLLFKLNYLHTEILPLIIALKLVSHFDLKVAALSMGLPTFI